MSAVKVKEFSLICFASFTIVIGCFIFCRGFLLNRHVFKEKSESCINIGIYDHDELVDSRCPTTPVFSKAIFVLLDALRYDFIFKMPFLFSLVDGKGMKPDRSESDSGEPIVGSLSCAFKFIADPPTTTMQRLKALMSGTMPTFIDASANFNSYEVEEDNLIYQLNVAGKRIAFLGDDTWLSLFPRSLFTSPYVEAHPSFDAWDLDTVDRAVNTSIIRLLQPENSRNWDVLIAHLLGVDHCGHRYGPNHPEMTRKLTEADQTIELIYSKMAKDTLLVVFGDHGMTKSGDHGGDSSNEVEAGIVFITKDEESADQPFHCHSTLQKPQIVSQIDFVPTVSHLLGIPIPFSSIGQLFPKFIPPSLYSSALMENVVQVSRYVTEFAKLSNAQLQEMYEKVTVTFKEFTIDRNPGTELKFHRQAEHYLSRVKSLAVSTWTEFDLGFIFCGIGISALGIASFAYTICVHFGQGISWILVILSSTGLLSILLNFFMQSSFGVNGVMIVTTAGVAIFLGATTILGIKISGARNPTVRISLTKQCDVASVVLYVFTCITIFSNSFVVNEGTVLGSVLIAVAFLNVLLQSFQWNDIQLNTFMKKSRGFLLNKKFLIWRNSVRCSWISLICLAVLVRIAGFFFRCREELTQCREEFMLHKSATSLPEDWIAYKCLRFGIALLSVAIAVVTFREWMLLRECISASRMPAALVGKYIPTILIVLIGAHWALEGLPFSSAHVVVIRPALSYFPMVYQTMTIVALFMIWIQPTCSSGCTITHHQSVEEKEDKSTTGKLFRNFKVTGRRGSVGHKNGLNSDVFNDRNRRSTAAKKNFSRDKDSWVYLLASGCHQDLFTCSLLINFVLVTLLLVQVTATGLVPAIMIIPYVIMAILNLNVDITTSKGSWSVTVLWTLACQYFFYCTGHHPVFSAIPWDSAFIGSASDGLGSSGSISLIAWIRPGLSVLGNLYAAQIIFSMALPLLVYWRGTPIPGILFGSKERSAVYSVGGKFIILHALKLLACMLCAAFHRRHLMVWKIFAPKLIFEIVSFLVVLISTILSLLFVTRVDHHCQKILANERTQLKRLLNSNP